MHFSECVKFVNHYHKIIHESQRIVASSGPTTKKKTLSRGWAVAWQTIKRFAPNTSMCYRSNSLSDQRTDTVDHHGQRKIISRIFRASLVYNVIVYVCVFRSYMIESPRWLATKGRLAECAAYLTTIARINGRPTDEITETYLKKILPNTQGGEQVYGMLSFFTGWRIARNTLVLVLCW